MRNLKSIQEEFVILNRYKKILEENKNKLTNTDENKEELIIINHDLEMIDRIMINLQFEVNENNNYLEEDVL